MEKHMASSGAMPAFTSGCSLVGILQSIKLSGAMPAPAMHMHKEAMSGVC